MLRAAIALQLLAVAARADEAPSELDLFQLEDKINVFLAARRPQPLREAPASVSIITADDLEAYGWRDFTEAVASLAGLYTSEARDWTYFGMRGVSQHGDFNGRMLVLVDGHMQQELWAHSFFPELAGLDATMIDHIEVLRGPASALYGSLGFLGIINVVTRRGGEADWARVGVDLSTATLSGRLSANVGHRFKNGFEWGVSLSATGDLGASYAYPDLAQNQGCIPGEFPRTCVNGVSDREVDRFGGVAAYGHAEWKGLSLKLSYQWADKNVPFAPYRTLFNDRANHYYWERGYVDLGYTLGRPDFLQGTARVYFDTHTYKDDLAYSADGTAAGRFLFHDEAQPWWTGGEVKLLAERQWGRLFAALTAGAELTYFSAEYESGTAGPDGKVILDPNDPNAGVAVSHHLLFGAAYAQAEASFARKIFLTVGLRYDFSDFFYTDPTLTSPSELSPRAALVWRPYETGTFKLLYGHGFKHPSWYQVFFTDNISIADNPRLQPERDDNFELVFEQQLSPQVTLTATTFYIRARNLIGETTVCVPETALAPATPDCPPTQSARAQRQNIASFDSIGGEAGIVGRMKEGTRFYGNYSLALVDDGTGERPFNSPAHMVKLGVSVPLWKNHFAAGAEFRLITGRRFDFNQGNVLESEPVYLVNLFVTWKGLPKGLNASLKLYNTFGQTWYEPSQAEDSFPIVRIPHGGPTATLRVSYTF